MRRYRKHRSATMDAMIGANIREARLSRGVSQTDLADALGMLPSQLSRVEQGRQVISVWLVVMVALELEIPYWRLIGGQVSSPGRPEDI